MAKEIKEVYLVFEAQPTQGNFNIGVFDDRELAENVRAKNDKKPGMGVFMEGFKLNVEYLGKGQQVIHGKEEKIKVC